MKFSFSREEYNLLKTIDFSEMEENARFSDEENAVYIKEEKLRLFRIIIAEEICRVGMTDDQQEVTPLGRKLYSLHDSFYVD